MHFFPGIACVQVIRQTWKPAVCFAFGAPVHIDDKAVICEKCEKAGIVPIYICCEEAEHPGYHERDLHFCRDLAGREAQLTVYSFREAVRFVCRLNTTNELVELCRDARAGAVPNPWSNEEDGHFFAHLN